MEPLFTELERREAVGSPLRVGVIGAGFFGAGLVRQLARVHGIEPAVVANRTLARAVAALESAGIEADQIAVCDDPKEAASALACGRYVVTSVLDLPCQMAAVDVVMETTGTVATGAAVTLAAFAAGKHVVSANLELHATLGPVLKRRADAAGVVYSDVDGDQPGMIMNLHSYCRGLGLEPIVAGNCKGFLNRYATPASQATFASANGIAPWIATAAADGTKINLEMAAVANATGMLPSRPGMIGVQTTLETLVEDLGRVGVLEGPPCVEYTFGIPSGAFVVARSDDTHLQREFHYLKMGEGPCYVFHEDRVVCHFDAPLSAARAALYQGAVITPIGPPLVEVGTFAKRDLVAGQRLDGIGGYDCYGLVFQIEDRRAANQFPIGLAEGCRLRRDVARDQPIAWHDVDIGDDLALALWREQAQPATAAVAAG